MKTPELPSQHPVLPMQCHGNVPEQPNLSALSCTSPAPAAHPNILHNPQHSPQAGMQDQAPPGPPWPLSIRLETLPAAHPLTPPCPPGLFTTGRAHAALQLGQHRQPARARGRLHTRLCLLRRLRDVAPNHTRTNGQYVTVSLLACMLCRCECQLQALLARLPTSTLLHDASQP